ncbi:hypothetical protein AVEN_164659-1 [Araneus ventricosus]|uniref:Uncharacterized protein n=1 Tax=Araneus ventricosus TaxID=182803 RepID=A0A4Y2RR95_ARAVE|nr:hypothetical protein AVEN_164659-1 [Araneus ventricosus]
MSTMPLSKKFVARDALRQPVKHDFGHRCVILGELLSKSHPIRLNSRCSRISVPIVCIFKPVEYSPRFPSSCLTGHVPQTFLLSGIVLVLMIKEYDSSPCDMRFTSDNSS